MDQVGSGQVGTNGEISVTTSPNATTTEYGCCLITAVTLDPPTKNIWKGSADHPHGQEAPVHPRGLAVPVLRLYPDLPPSRSAFQRASTWAFRPPSTKPITRDAGPVPQQ